MIFYIASPTYQQVIHKTIQESGLILEGYECTRDIYLRKYVKENLAKLDNLELLIIDLYAINDTENEICEAIDTLKIMANNTRIIILACNRVEGDMLLTKLFQSAIFDIINTDDFNEIREELRYCMLQGKQYKDAIRFKDVRPGQENVITRTEVKQTVNKIMLAFAGAQEHIGTTHNCMILANYLRKKGYMVAVVEHNKSGCFQEIREAFEENMFENFFTMNGIDYYPDVAADQLNTILGKTYNFILVDYGKYSFCDHMSFNRADECFVVLGSKPWELSYANQVFGLGDAAAKYYHYLFNFTEKVNQKDIIQGMTGIESVHFLEYTENPFNNYNFCDAEKILKDYLPVKVETTKPKGLWGRKKK